MNDLFISYSWNDVFTEDLCLALEANIDAGSYRLLRDQKRIEPGDGWRPEINAWMSSCQGSILLFSKKALESNWVKYEAAILAWRKALQPKFVLVPVLLEGVTDTDIRTGAFEALFLGEITPLKLAAGESAAKLAKRIQQVLGEQSWQQVPDHMAGWIDKIGVGIGKAKVMHYLEEAETQLGIDAQLRGLFADRNKTMAYELLHADGSRVAGALWPLADAISDPLALGELLDLLRPNWVRPDAASAVISTTLKPQGERLLTINHKDTKIAIDYVERSLCCSIQHILVHTESITSQQDLLELKNAPPAQEPGFIKRQFGDGLRHHLGLGLDEPYTGVVTWLGRTRVPIFMTISCRSIHPLVLARLLELYPQVTFVLLPGGEFPTANDLGLTSLNVLQPLLDDEAMDQKKFFEVTFRQINKPKPLSR